MVADLDEARRPEMKEHEGEENDSGHPLHDGERAVARGPAGGSGPLGRRQEEPVDAVEKERQADDEDLQHDGQGELLQALRRLVVSIGACRAAEFWER